MPEDIVRTRFFTDHGTMAFDEPRDAFLARIELLRGSIFALEGERREDRYREILVRAKTYLLGGLENETIFGQAAAVIHELAARQPGLDADTATYFMGVDTGESLRFNAYSKDQHKLFSEHCELFAKNRAQTKKRRVKA